MSLTEFIASIVVLTVVFAVFTLLAVRLRLSLHALCVILSAWPWLLYELHDKKTHLRSK